MGYTLDLKKIPIEEYLKLLKNQDLLPGRRLLLCDIDLNFGRIAAAGIANVAELKTRLSTLGRPAALSAATGIPEDYLVILKRELNSLEQKPVPLSAFPGIGTDSVARLGAVGIKTSKDFFERYGAEGIGLNDNTAAELAALCTLVRINGVGPAAARTIYESGYTCIADIAGADAGVLLDRMQAVNAGQKYYQAKLGLKDTQFVIDGARLIRDVEARR